MGAAGLVMGVCTGSDPRPVLGGLIFVGMLVCFLVLPFGALITARAETQAQVVATALFALAGGVALAAIAFSGGGGDGALALGIVSGVGGLVIGIVVSLLDERSEMGEFARSAGVGLAASVAPFVLPIGLLFGSLAATGSCLD